MHDKPQISVRFMHDKPQISVGFMHDKPQISVGFMHDKPQIVRWTGKELHKHETRDTTLELLIHFLEKRKKNPLHEKTNIKS